ncbi:MAG: 1,4-alpha-glucan branching protein GlgB [Clostridia bacterium]|nr:1,4-alpha-glucan branching protein GlgB [Clostridia bacterium]
MYHGTFWDTAAFHNGTERDLYGYLGAHPVTTDEGFSCVFRVWAPNASQVSLICEKTGWDKPQQMKIFEDSGVWETELFSSSSFSGVLYKFIICGNDGVTREKNDPFAFGTEFGGGRASIIAEPHFAWDDKGYLEYRSSLTERSKRTGRFYPAPLNIYEVHLGSFITENGESTRDGKHYSHYKTIAPALAGHVKRCGFTHVELLPVMEHPFDGSWGYQITGYYSPTSRFGKPEDFAYFINFLHRTGIGVILDWVPAHFPKDGPGLSKFDGTPLFEYGEPGMMENKGWGTLCFDVGKPEVRSFLISNALFWFREYHVDGLRADAVASMLYLDYDKEPGEWIPGKYGDNRNAEAADFFRELNTAVFSEFPDALMIAEESTAWQGVTHPADRGGLGFNFKWNMGWANDMFDYVSADPLYRSGIHSKLTFPLFYAFSENFILPVSHDEVVHGKKSLIDKMWGSYDEKFSMMRAFLLFMMTFPGKKLLFMGCEYAQFREWDYENQLEWFMKDFTRHGQMESFVCDLNEVYISEPSLWEIDFEWDGFEWIDTNDQLNNTLSYARKSIAKDSVVAVFNFSATWQRPYVFSPNCDGEYRVIISTDDLRYGGTGGVPSGSVFSCVEKLSLNMAPLSAALLKRKTQNGAIIVREVN